MPWDGISIERFKKFDSAIDGMICARIHKLLYTPTHLHEYFEIEYILSGSGVTYLNGKAFPIKPGLVYFASPINTHKILADNNDNERLIHINFSEHNCNQTLLAYLSASASPIAFYLQPDEQRFFESIANELLIRYYDTAYATNMLDVLLKKLCYIYDEQHHGNVNEMYSSFQKSILYIISNYQNDISLTEVAEHVGFNPTYFSTLFKQKMHVNFKEYINSLRFNLSKNMLRLSEMDIKEICYASGFSNYENFIRRFKSRFGYTPGEYRKKHTKS